MTIEELNDELDKWENVKSSINQEGIEYCFRSYSNFEEIDDEEFHLKREKLIELMTEMEEYIQQKIIEVEDEICEHPEHPWNKK